MIVDTKTQGRPAYLRVASVHARALLPACVADRQVLSQDGYGKGTWTQEPAHKHPPEVKAHQSSFTTALPGEVTSPC